MYVKSLKTPLFCNSGIATGISRKDEIFNELIEDFRTRGATFQKSVAEEEGRYIIQVFPGISHLS